MFEVLILAIITGFILTKLFKTLGKVEDGDEAARHEVFRSLKEYNKASSTEADIHIASAFEASLPQEVRDVFDSARHISPTFNAENFLKRAQMAFEMIVKAFTNGDKSKLQPLVSKDVFNSFEHEMQRRYETKEVCENTIVKFRVCEIVKAELNNNILSISVRFVTEQINLIKDSLGNIISGDPSHIEVVHDIWVFAKHLKTNNLIWELVETKST